MKIELINIELGDYLFIGRPLTLWPLECAVLYCVVSRFAAIVIIIVLDDGGDGGGGGGGGSVVYRFGHRGRCCYYFCAICRFSRYIYARLFICYSQIDRQVSFQ